MVGAKQRVTNLHIFVYLASPAFWLLFERGNFDLLVFFLVFLAIMTIRTRIEILGIIFVGISALFKFYTLPLLLLIPFLTDKRFIKISSIVTFITLLPFILWNITLVKTFPNPTFAAFGSPSFGLWVNFFSWRYNLDLKMSDSIAHLSGLIIFICLTIVLTRSGYLQKKLDLRWSTVKLRKIDLTYLFFSATYLICYLAGMNFDYRLIFLIASLIICSIANPTLFQNAFFQLIAHASIWFTFFFFGATGAIPVILALIGNIAQGMMAVILAFDILQKLGLLASIKTLKNSLDIITQKLRA
jgi:hypothetical protein